MKKMAGMLVMMILVSVSTGCISQEKPSAATGPTAQAIEPQELVLATTTSTYDSGLLGVLNPVFERKYNCVVKVIPKGTGAAIQTAKDGDADIILVHSRKMEDAFVNEGYGVNRRDVMHNDFVIIGPESDPAGIKGMSDASEAFRKIAQSQALFFSRGDNSGTHYKEQAIWEKAGITPTGTWYQSTGRGMGDTITMTNEQLGYTLVDRGTFYSREANIELIVLVEGDPLLYNPYGVIAVNPAKYPDVNYELAMCYIAFLTSPEGQRMINEYRKNGKQLFYPDAIREFEP
jgi:tungstate transport system substrate-binding protein